MVKRIPKKIENMGGHGMVFRGQPSIEAEYQHPLEVYSLICHDSHCGLLLFH